MAKTLLCESDFRGEVNVPGTERTEVLRELNRLICKYEPEFMRYALGPAFAAAVYSQADQNTVADPYLKLINGGTTWTDSDSDDHYLDGLKYCVARYVWFHWSREHETVSTPSGEKKQETDNSTDASPAARQASRWNEMSNALLSVWQFLDCYLVDGESPFSTYKASSVQQWRFEPVNTFGI